MLFDFCATPFQVRHFSNPCIRVRRGSTYDTTTKICHRKARMRPPSAGVLASSVPAVRPTLKYSFARILPHKTDGIDKGHIFSWISPLTTCVTDRWSVGSLKRIAGSSPLKGDLDEGIVCPLGRHQIPPAAFQATNIAEERQRHEPENTSLDALATQYYQEESSKLRQYDVLQTEKVISPYGSITINSNAIVYQAGYVISILRYYSPRQPGHDSRWTSVCNRYIGI